MLKEVLRKTTEIISHIWSPGQDLNTRPPVRKEGKLSRRLPSDFPPSGIHGHTAFGQC